jgi:hypothetical protein
MVAFADAVYRRAILAALAVSTFGYGGLAASAVPWDDDPAVQEVSLRWSSP